MTGPEIVFGIVGATGTDHESVAAVLSGCLADIGYQTEQVRVIELVTRLDAYSQLPVIPEDQRISTRMDAGDDFRSRTARADALAAFSVSEIAERRRAMTSSLYITDEQLEIANFLDRLKELGLLSPKE